MEIRVLEYFLAVAREQNITSAAEFLHLTQPTLSRQLRDLEDEFGKQLFIRGKRRITLTEDGVYFRKKAEEIVTLAHRTEAEMKNVSQTIVGDIYIGAGETEAVGNIVKVARDMQKEYSGVRFHITSGDTSDLTDRLDKGLFDFCLLLGEIDQSKYEYLPLTYTDTWGVLMHRDSPLAEKEKINSRDLWDKPLIMSRQAMNVPQFMRWFGRSPSELNIAATYNLAFNASIMARERMGYVLTLDRLINTEGTDLCFRALEPEMTVGMALVWKKYQPQSKAAEKFIERVSEGKKFLKKFEKTP